MREIKFRAWSKHFKKYFYDISPLPFGFIASHPILAQPDLEAPTLVMQNLEDEVVIEQYTGLKDKNGKEIYEGDIINYLGYASNGEKCKKCGHKESGNTKMRVWIEDGHTRHTADSCDSGYANLTIEDSGHIEIIGNIYSNPELLK